MKKKTKTIILVVVLLGLVVGAIMFFLFGQGKVADKTALSSSSTSTTKVSSSIDSQSSSSQSKSSVQSSEPDVTTALSSSSSFAVAESNSMSDSVKEARAKMKAAGIDSSDFSNSDIEKYIELAKKDGTDLITYLKKQGF